MAKDAEITERVEYVEEITDQLDLDECDRDEGEVLYEEEYRLVAEVRNFSTTATEASWNLSSTVVTAND